MVLGLGGGDDWAALDAKVNVYPSRRQFKAIGSGGEDFVLAMMAAATSVTGEPLAREEVVVRSSRTASYQAVAVTVVVRSGEQVKAIFENMRADKRVRAAAAGLRTRLMQLHR